MRLVLFVILVFTFLNGSSIGAPRFGVIVGKTKMDEFTRETARPDKGANIEVDIFSGRPNPSWFLSTPETKTLEKMIGSLQRAQPRSPVDELGYRGFIITFTRSVSRMKRVVVSRDVVKLDPTDYRNDPNRTVERWLLTKAKSGLKRADYEALAKAIED